MSSPTVPQHATALEPGCGGTLPGGWENFPVSRRVAPARAPAARRWTIVTHGYAAPRKPLSSPHYCGSCGTGLPSTTGRRYREEGSTMALSATASVLTALVDSPGAREIAFGGNSMQHGTAVFEGIRCYRGRTGVNAFRLDDHLRRSGLGPRTGLAAPIRAARAAWPCLARRGQQRSDRPICSPGSLLRSAPARRGVGMPSVLPGWSLAASTDIQWSGSSSDGFAVASPGPVKLSGWRQGDWDLCDVGNRQNARLAAGLRRCASTRS